MGIKMICSDLDGTILSYSQTEITPRMQDQIRALHEKGVIFVPASGRQIVSMQKLFHPVKECCYYICSNGAVICDGEGRVIEKLAMSKEEAFAIAYDFMENTDGRGEVNLAGARVCHLWSRNLGMEKRLKYIGNEYEIIQKPEEIQDEIVKVSCYIPSGAEAYIDRFAEKWKAYNAAMAGALWIDTMLANKGVGVDNLCRILEINAADAAAFGDHYNDVEMLQRVGHPYLMSTAPEELLQRFPNHTSNVEDSLDEILASL